MKFSTLAVNAAIGFAGLSSALPLLDEALSLDNITSLDEALSLDDITGLDDVFQAGGNHTITESIDFKSCRGWYGSLHLSSIHGLKPSSCFQRGTGL